MAEGKIQQAQDTSERLKQLYELALTVAGDTNEVFDRIVRIIAELFGVRVALVERLEGDKIITLSMYLDGKIIHEGVFDLAGTPCADVREKRSFCAFNSAVKNYPHDKFLADLGLESYVGVPVVGTDGDVIAIINAMSDRPIMLTEDDKLFFQALASRVRLELERAHEATEAAAVRLLLDLSKELTRVRPLDEILVLVADCAREVLGVDIAAVATTDDSMGTTSWKAMSGFRTDTYKHIIFAPGKGSAGRAIQERKTLVLEGIGQSPDLPAEEFPIHIAEDVINSLAIPLMIGERVLGVLIAGYRSEHLITEQEVKLGEAIGAQAAVAIENGRLFMIAFWLGPATVALAVPLHRNAHRLKGFVVPMLVAIPIGALVSIVTAVVMVQVLGGSDELARTLAPKAATTPVSLALSGENGGIPALTAVLTIFIGILGAVAGPAVLTLLRVRDRRARGLAMGAVSHGVGTSRSLHDDETEGAFSGLSMGLTALATSLLLPVVLHFLL